jgi:hypothetical protein
MDLSMRNHRQKFSIARSWTVGHLEGSLRYPGEPLVRGRIDFVLCYAQYLRVFWIGAMWLLDRKSVVTRPAWGEWQRKHDREYARLSLIEIAPERIGD